MKELKVKFLRAGRVFSFCLLGAALLGGTAFVSSTNVSANHPVLVEGNCDSPVPGTTLVTTAGTCGDFDGDGRIGTAEDTDGADRIFGTINAALGPGTGAAAGTGANHNGLVRIVKSGRFAENVYIGVTQQGTPPLFGTANPGNVTLEAAPGVHAIIDAVLQGDPAGGNATRQAGTGIAVRYSANGSTRVVTLRNLTVRNFANGIGASENTRIHIDNCRLENNLNYGISLSNNSRGVIRDTTVTASGFRIGGPSVTPNPGVGILVDQAANAKIVNSTISHSAAFGIWVKTASGNATLYKVSNFFNDGGDQVGNVVLCTDAAPCN